ncbi:MAG: ABC transporter ATP-binding protein, partial [Ruminococcaceae bacterium]|nr:ABC transporter ATP-binding protein [Oscillospiraceae bacterium]
MPDESGRRSSSRNANRLLTICLPYLTTRRKKSFLTSSEYCLKNGAKGWNAAALMKKIRKKDAKRSHLPTMLKRFLGYYKPHMKIFILDMLASLVVALVGIVYPMVTRTLLNDYFPNREYRMIVILGGTLLLLYLVRMLLNYFIQYYGHVMGVRMQAEMRSDMFRHLEKLPYSFYDKHETGK